eukprot:5238314-Pyramimonas_sp.AAC.1
MMSCRPPGASTRWAAASTTKKVHAGAPARRAPRPIPATRFAAPTRRNCIRRGVFWHAGRGVPPR